MKIIDEKGRLFGKINLIDLLVLVLVVAVVLAVGWKLVGKKAAASVSNNNHEITFTVLFEDQPIEVAEFAETQIGKQIVNNAKLVSAEITGCEAVSSIRTLGHSDLSPFGPPERSPAMSGQSAARRSAWATSIFSRRASLS